MRVIKPRYEIWDIPTGDSIMKKIERCGRICWKSEDKIEDDSAEGFVGRLLDKGHVTPIEHAGMTVFFVIDRGVSHELVRHRLMSPSQESTRFCNYAKDKFGSEITFIKPLFWDRESSEYRFWEHAMGNAENSYFDLIGSGVKPQAARSVLPNSLKTEIAVTANMVEWRHIFKLRCGRAAHPQMREVMCPLLTEVRETVPIIFDDILSSHPQPNFNL
jgi:thymidylate synthase (FAD)